MRLRGYAIGCAAGVLVLSGKSAADEPHNALESNLSVGWVRQISPSVDHTYERDSTNGGPSVHGGVLLRTRYFLSPFLDVGYLRLYGSDERKDLGAPLGVVESHNSLSALSLILGPAIDIYRLRLRAGMGVYRLRVESSVLGTTITPTEIDLGYLVTVGVALVRSERWKVGVESRAFLVSEAETAGVSLGIAGAWDTVRW